MKLQSALEYLTTYGWAILIIGIAVAVLYSTQVFNQQPQVCVLQAGFNCTFFAITSNGLLTIAITQTTGGPINITAVGCYQTNNPSNIQVLAKQVYVPQSLNATFTIQCYTSASTKFSTPIGTSFVGGVSLNYTDLTTSIPQLATGKLSVKATS